MSNVNGSSTAQSQAAGAVDELRDVLEELECESPDGFVALAAVRGAEGHISDFRVSYANLAAERMLPGYRGLLQRDSLRQTLHSSEDERALSFLVELATAKRPERRELRVCAGQAELSLDLVITPLRDGLAVRFRDKNSASPRLAATQSHGSAPDPLPVPGSFVDTGKVVGRQEERDKLLAALSESDARYRSLFQSLDDGYCLLQLVFDENDRAVDYRFLETNTAFEVHTGLKDAVGKTVRELVPDLDESWFELYGEVALSGQARRFENHAPAMGRWFEVFASRTGDPARRQVAVLFKNVTERRQAEEERVALLAREKAAREEAVAERQKLHDVFMQAPAAICILEGPDHTFTFANPLYRALVGGRELVGKPLVSALPELQQQGVENILDQVMSTGQPFFGNEMLTQLKREGTLEHVFLNFVCVPKCNAAGEVDGVLASAVDVTPQVRARQRVEALAATLRENEERLRRVVDASGTGTWELDVATGDVTADARFRELCGVSAQERLTLNKNLALVHPDDRPRVTRAVNDALAGKSGGRYLAEYRSAYVPDGTVRWVEARGQATFGDDGKPVAMLGTGIDITGRKLAEAAREELLQALSAQTSIYVAVLRGPNLVYEMVNSLYERSAQGRYIVGKPLLEAFPELAGQGIEELMTRVMRTGEPFIGREMPVTLESENGPEERFFTAVYQPVRGSSGDTEAILSITSDVTDVVRARREAERRVQQEKERADFEQQLIGIVSHDLRNPLNVVQLAAAALARRELDERAAKNVLRIQTSAERATRLVKDLLDFTQARLGGGIPVEPKRLDWHTFAESVVEEVQASFPERDIRLKAEGNGDGEWDPDRIAQVVTNLVSNAVKYSPPQTTVSVRTRGDGSWVMLEVHNQGTPIAPEAHARLFEPMQRATSQIDKSGRSVGLGLYIVKQIVDAHGGTIEAKSDADEGTTFTVKLPRRAPQG